MPLSLRTRAFAALLVAIACLLLGAPPAPSAVTGGASLAAATPPGGGRLGQRPLRIGARGDDVHALQDLLTRAGYPTPRGAFGPLTQRNVEAFQLAAGLPADGVVTAALVDVLRQAARGAALTLPPLPDETDPPVTPPPPPPPSDVARLRANGTAAAPAGAPAAVRAVIAAANRIASTPYVWGGGHGHWRDRGYDCSGSVGYALHGGGLLDASATSGDLESYGAPGPGRWITLYANRDHVFAVIAGLRYDTSGANPSRWQPDMRSGNRYVVRHPSGL